MWGIRSAGTRTRNSFATILLGCSLACTSNASNPQSLQDSGTPTSNPTDARTTDSQTDPPVDAGAPSGTDTGPADAGAEAQDPFAPQPDTSGGLTNISANLEAVLENGQLRTACDAFRADPTNPTKKLMCGKAMFFYEGFGTIGVPAVLFDFFAKEFEQEVGIGYSRYGLIPDPYSQDSRPLGAAPGAPLGMSETVAFTCASCHFARLPDGRYAVGAPNHDYDYGKQILTIALAPGLLSPNADLSQHHPDAIAAVQPVLTKLQNDRRLRIRLLIDLIPLAGMAGMPAFTNEQEGQYASWKPGTMDFLMSPLPLDDGVHTISKIIDLWGIPTEEEQSRAELPHALLAWTGAAPSLEQFLDGFVRIGGGPVEEWTPEALSPLADYIRTLQAPQNPSAGDPAKGRSLFDNLGCIDCHDGPRGSGRRVYDFDEVGTDDQMKRWGDPMLSGTACCGLQEDDERLTHAVKSPRLTGLWAKAIFLHNGAVDSLSALLCLAPRADITTPGYGDGGHTYGCDAPEADRRALLRFLLTL